MHAAFNRDDGAWFFDHCHPDVEWMAAREDPDAATHAGRNEIERYFAQWSAEMIEDLSIEGKEYIDAGDRVFAWIRIMGRGKGSGVPVEMEQAQVWSLRDGKVARVEEYFDRDEGLAVAGLAGRGSGS
jgi:ketosteroid isomerase-like protein